MKRDFRSLTVAIAAGMLAFGALPAMSQERPSPGASPGGGSHASSPPSSGGGSSSSSGSSGGGSSTSSSGGSSMGSGGASGGGDHAVSRGGDGRSRGSGMGAPSRSGSPRSVILPSGSTARERDPGDRVATPSPRERTEFPSDTARRRGDRPSTGTAVNRPDISNVPPIAWLPPGGNTGVWYPCYGFWGTCYYDPFWWDYYYGYAPGYYGYGDYYAPQGDYDTGSVKLKVKPRSAQVYVDGYFSGVVDDYDGTFQRLKLRPGAHRIELRAENYETAAFDVLVVAGETVTYRAELKKR